MTLTRYPEASFRELVAISIPMMVAIFSFVAMMFVDRLFLAYYSLDAFNASSSAVTLAWAIITVFTAVSNIAEVFVSQRNGAKRYQEIGEPVWQMLWFSLFSFLYFVPFAFFGTKHIFGTNPIAKLSKDYFFWMILAGPLFTANTAIIAFFVGRGKLKEIMLLSVVANVVNIFFDYLFIFGVKGWWAPMGTKGAAIATSMGEVVQLSLYFALFIRPSARRAYGTGAFRIHWPLFRDCLRIGLPTAFFSAFEILGFSMYYFIHAAVGTEAMTLASVCHSYIILLWFFTDGVHMSVKTIVGNLIGAKKTELVSQVLKNGIILHLLFAVAMFLVFWLFSDSLIHLFLSHEVAEVSPDLHAIVWMGLLLTIVYILGEGIRMVFSGILTSSGDTRFLMVAGVLANWFLLVLPVYVVLVLYRAPIMSGMIICTLYSVLATLIYFARVASGKWKTIQIEQSPHVLEVIDSR